MKITEIRAAGLRHGTPEGRWSNEIRPDDCVHTLIAVVTDQGVTGWGSVFTNDQLVQGALGVLEPLYAGENPLEPERVSEKLHANTFSMGRGGSITHTISWASMPQQTRTPTPLLPPYKTVSTTTHDNEKDMTCPVCGSTNFTQNKVLWPELVAEWELQPHERDYIDEQQGFHCLRCQANLRAMTLACAIMTAFNFNGLFSTWVDRSRLAILEINEAYTLTSFTSRVPGHVLAKYPDVDMHALPYRDGKFDLVLHSDTLEHVQDPVSALSECRRVLKPDGCMVYTIPIIVGRMSRSRVGMPPSYHGTPETLQNDHLDS